MSTDPLVSIIMPAYRAEATLKGSVQSVLEQTLQSWELIIVDDGSPDRTLQIANELAASEGRIRVLTQSNSGPSIARNFGIQHAAADIVAFLDADDFWAPDRLSGLVAFLGQNAKAGVVFSRTRFVDNETLAPGTLTPFVQDLTAADLIAENQVCSTSNIVCRKQVLFDCGAFTSGLNYAEDQEWLLRVALDARWSIKGVDEEWFYYRSSRESQSSDLDAMEAGWTRMVTRVRQEYPVATRIALKHAFGPFYRQLSRRALRLGKPGQALKYIRLGLFRDPALVLRQPRRTLLTLAGTLAAFIPNSKLRELVAK